jgi:hypothetical protein
VTVTVAGPSAQIRDDGHGPGTVASRNGVWNTEPTVTITFQGFPTGIVVLNMMMYSRQGPPITENKSQRIERKRMQSKAYWEAFACHDFRLGV